MKLNVRCDHIDLGTIDIPYKSCISDDPSKHQMLGMKMKVMDRNMTVDVVYVPHGHIDSFYYSDGSERVYNPHDDMALLNLI